MIAPRALLVLAAAVASASAPASAQAPVWVQRHPVVENVGAGAAELMRRLAARRAFPPPNPLAGRWRGGEVPGPLPPLAGDGFPEPWAPGATPDPVRRMMDRAVEAAPWSEARSHPCGKPGEEPPTLEGAHMTLEEGDTPHSDELTIHLPDWARSEDTEAEVADGIVTVRAFVELCMESAPVALDEKVDNDREGIRETVVREKRVSETVSKGFKLPAAMRGEHFRMRKDFDEASHTLRLFLVEATPEDLADKHAHEEMRAQGMMTDEGELPHLIKDMLEGAEHEVDAAEDQLGSAARPEDDKSEEEDEDNEDDDEPEGLVLRKNPPAPAAAAGADAADDAPPTDPAAINREFPLPANNEPMEIASTSEEDDEKDMPFLPAGGEGDAATGGSSSSSDAANAEAVRAAEQAARNMVQAELVG